MTLQRKQRINVQYFKLYYIVQVCNKTIKSHLKICGRKTCKFDDNLFSKELKSSTSVIKFIGLRNKSALSRKVAHTFSGNFRTLFVHFAVNINEKLIQLDYNFNYANNGQIEQKENQDCKRRISTSSQKEHNTQIKTKAMEKIYKIVKTINGCENNLTLPYGSQGEL
ncbi:hypothetical protein RFI_32979 [Reticulomyxa filosa]|uniref:Uncharacterized protein n=1 Tax=Reticulomyxa filosa TaxID=46433 RepID=X6LS25_RETFI|nr:hypothetical protein RFI_32979 [Reticulomyxa filosa]|eukprot:ETO04419.1 hypothetical protein RFI_32979 [Reticulomyxa filosa]